MRQMVLLLLILMIKMDINKLLGNIWFYLYPLIYLFSFATIFVRFFYYKKNIFRFLFYFSISYLVISSISLFIYCLGPTFKFQKTIFETLVGFYYANIFFAFVAVVLSILFSTITFIWIHVIKRKNGD